MKKLLLKIKALWNKVMKSADDIIISHVDEAIDVVNVVKGFLNSKTAITLEMLIEGFLRINLPDPQDIVKRLDSVLQGLYAAQPCTKLATTEDRLRCVIDAIRGIDNSAIGNELLGIATRYFMSLHPEMSETEAKFAIQGVIYDRKTNTGTI